MEQNPETPVSLTEREGHPVLVLRGAVDIFVAESLHRLALGLAERGDDTVVDCASVTQLGSAACQILLALENSLRSKGRRLLLQEVPSVALDQLRLAGVESALPLEKIGI